MKKFDSIEELAQAYANSVNNRNPDAENAYGLMYSACIFGATEAWRELKTLNFGQAIQALKAGKLVRRDDWDLNLFVIKQVPAYITGDVVPKMQSLPESAKKAIMNTAQFISYTSQCLIYDRSTGKADSWAPTISDVFAEDWVVWEV